MTVTTRRTLMVGGALSFGFMMASGAQAQGNGVWVVTGAEAAMPPSPTSKAGRSITRVSDEPTMISVAMFAVDGSAASSVVTTIRSSVRPTAWPNTSGVEAGRCVRKRSKALPSCHGRAFDNGL